MLSKIEAKYITSLSQKKLREAENAFIIEGPKIIAEALAAARVKIKKIYTIESSATYESAAVPVEYITEAELKKISQLKTPNQVLAIVEITRREKFFLNKDAIALALDGIQDPGNMGTIVRIADWFGIKQIICSNDCADIYNSKVVQATMGSIFRVDVFYTELSAWLAKQTDIDVYGAALNGDNIKQYKKVKNGIIVIGNESKGIRPDVLSYIQHKITIERLGEAESLNAAVATGIILSHLK